MQNQIEAERGQHSRDFGEAQFSRTSIFDGVERGTANARFLRQFGLAELEAFTPLGDFGADRGEVGRLPIILGNVQACSD